MVISLPIKCRRCRSLTPLGRVESFSVILPRSSSSITPDFVLCSFFSEPFASQMLAMLYYYMLRNG
jgi:hypothetical protein